MTKLTVREESYRSLVQEIKDVMVECSFTSRWVLIEGYHIVGGLIVNYDKEKKGIDITTLVEDISIRLRVSLRKIWYAVKFYRTFPDLNLLPEGKDTSWHQIVRKYLTEGKKDGETPPKTKQSSSLPPGQHQSATALWIAHCLTKGCVIHGHKNGDAEPHHFPITKGAGATDIEVIPLCRECHDKAQRDGHRFWSELLWEYKRSFTNTYLTHIIRLSNRVIELEKEKA